MADIEIHGLPQSNFVWATRIAAGEKGVAHRLVPSPPHTPDILAINPLGKVPVMRHGDVAIAESRAIIGYIDAAFDGPALRPADAVAAARAEQWASYVQTAAEPVLIRQYVFAYFFPKTADKSPDRAAIDAVMPEVTRHMGILAQAVQSGAIDAGAPGVAQSYLTPILFYLDMFPETKGIIAAAPALAAYLATQMARPAVQATLPPPLPA